MERRESAETGTNFSARIKPTTDPHASSDKINFKGTLREISIWGILSIYVCTYIHIRMCIFIHTHILLRRENAKFKTVSEILSSSRN